jgi:hypothetical protein
MSAFYEWWYETGSGIAPLPNHDHEEHAERVARVAWETATEQLRKERDEARLNLCDMYTRTQPTGCQMKAEDYAKDHGWDCFKEAK